MTDIEKVEFQDEEGQTYTLLVQNKTPIEVPADAIPQRQPATDSEYDESYGLTEEAIVKLKDIHGAIRVYTNYAIGAFKNLAGTQVEEITLKFGLKIAGKAGIPILTEGSAESNFEIEVKCKPL